MHHDTPTVYLLSGSPGSGKATYAEVLASGGAIHLAPDEQTGQRLIDHVRAGRDVVLAEGLEELAEREHYKRLVEQHGGQWCVIHLTADHAGTIGRLAADIPLWTSA